MPDLGGPDGRDIDPRQPERMCLNCAEAEGGAQRVFPAWVMGQCDCCGLKTAVTDPKAYGGLEQDWEQRIQRLRPAVDEAA